MNHDEDIYSYFCCSESMRLQLDGLLDYLSLIGADCLPTLDSMKEASLLPCGSRQEGKKRLDEFKRLVLTSLSDISCDPSSHSEAFAKDISGIPPRHNIRSTTDIRRITDIYIERAALDRPMTERIRGYFSKTVDKEHTHTVDSYKDVFYHPSDGRALILAVKRDHFVMKGAPVCQSFDEEHFYYTSSVMNCIYDCEYCYLKGMFPSSHMVIYVDPEDTFAEVDELLKKHRVYLCISYDTDLMAIESMTGCISLWNDYVSSREGLRIECRTKCARTDIWDRLTPNDSFIYAYTLSPDPVINAHEHGTPSLTERLDCIKAAIERGFTVRLCFDPMIYMPGWKDIYRDMFAKVKKSIELDRIRDVSIGSFRISDSYLRSMRKKLPGSALIRFPFDNAGGVYRYPSYIADEMISLAYDELSGEISPDKIFTDPRMR
ncbi:MAG TPA: DNA repair photolyase [Lachnospiraceae bacterium]|nr:DNA repair photolyase [Lachnospiraceae bacterium]